MTYFYKTLNTFKLNHKIVKILWEQESQVYILVSRGEILAIDKSRKAIEHKVAILCR